MFRGRKAPRFGGGDLAAPEQRGIVSAAMGVATSVGVASGDPAVMAGGVESSHWIYIYIYYMYIYILYVYIYTHILFYMHMYIYIY